jgi:hypothetical protein
LSRVNIVKRIKIGGRWKMFSIPRNAKGNYDWNAIADGRYYVEWYVGGTRRRVSAGVTAAQALEVQRRKHHELEGRKLGIPGFETAGETVKKPALHVAITKYLEQIEALKKPNTYRKYEAVLNRFGEFFRDCVSIDAISGDDLTRFVVTLKKDHGLGSNTILHNAVSFPRLLGFAGEANRVAADQQVRRKAVSRRQTEHNLSHLDGIADLFTPIRFQGLGNSANGRFIVGEEFGRVLVRAGTPVRPAFRRVQVRKPSPNGAVPGQEIP